jgi:hypothetical protein
MTSRTDAFLVAAGCAADLLENPAVAGKWPEPSALAEFTVRGLAGHLASQVLMVRGLITAETAVGTETVDLLDHYERASWRGADISEDVNVGIRHGGEQRAKVGPAFLVTEVRAAIEDLRPILSDVDGQRAVPLAFAGWALRVDDLITTRLMEIAVHSDDLAVSVGIPTPALPPEVLEPVYDLLFRLSVRRHGPTAMLRALSRAERAPASIAAI